MKKVVKIFVSYASKNSALAENFLEKLEEQLMPSKSFRYSIWWDRKILIGEDWSGEIDRALKDADAGLLLLSPAFLGSKYIEEVELPVLIRKRNCFPIMLQPLDLDRHDLRGLERSQIYRLKAKGFSEPRSYGECRGQRRADFCHEVFAEIDDCLREQIRE